MQTLTKEQAKALLMKKQSGEQLTQEEKKLLAIALKVLANSWTQI